MRALWIEILKKRIKEWDVRSRPVRALWIEILKKGRLYGKMQVEAREGLVD